MARICVQASAHPCLLQVMVAEPRSRRKGIARESVQLMMAFAIRRMGITRFR